MVFLCEECIKDYYIDIPKLVLEHMRSTGPCEDCHEVKLCYDVPHGKYMQKDSPMAQRLRKTGQLKGRILFGKVR